jgi:DNA-binding MurR/RpiR family transcriptional regulator
VIDGFAGPVRPLCVGPAGRIVVVSSPDPEPTAGAGPSLADRLRTVRNDLAPAEARVVATLLDDYPMAGLQSVARFAAAAGVSAPTVLRVLGKLGFSGYPEFREALRREASERLFSSVEVYPGPAATDAGDGIRAFLAQAERTWAAAVRDTFASLDPDAVERTVGLLADRARPLLLTGGRFTTAVAGHLGRYLTTLRGGVRVLEPESGARALALLDVDETTVVLTVDVRPHQGDTVRFGLDARARGATVVLLTDRSLSPLAPDADLVLVTSVLGPPPFDATAPAVAVVDTLVAAVAARLGDAARTRLAAFERWASPS